MNDISYLSILFCLIGLAIIWYEYYIRPRDRDMIRMPAIISSALIIFGVTAANFIGMDIPWA